MFEIEFFFLPFVDLPSPFVHSSYVTIEVLAHVTGENCIMPRRPQDPQGYLFYFAYEVRILTSQMVTSFWKVLETLESGILLKKANHRGKALGGPWPLPVCLPAYWLAKW